MSRPVSILIFPSPLFPAHWSLFIPSIVTEAIGTRIHVHGNARSGFTHEFVRNYDIAPSTQGDKLVPLGWVDGRLLESNDGLGTSESAECNGGLTESRDVDAKNELERIALSVRAPGPSLNTLQKLPSGKRVEIQNCQTWLRQLVAAYVDKGVLELEALDAADGAPKN